jgi:hypothetical protein
MAAEGLHEAADLEESLTFHAHSPEAAIALRYP